MDLSKQPVHDWPTRYLKKRLEELSSTTEYSSSYIQEELRSRRTRLLSTLLTLAICLNAVVVAADFVIDFISRSPPTP